MAVNNAGPSAAMACGPDDQARDHVLEWVTSIHPVDYEDALKAMDERVAAIVSGSANELVWLLEHPPLYTAGTSARPEELLDNARFPVFPTGRGGRFTYHGPGQRVAYVMLDLRRRKPDVRWFVCTLEDWLIATLRHFGIRGQRLDGQVGIWVSTASDGSPTQARKIAAIGVRVRRWITFHGISLNVAPDMDHFSGIVPCGISDLGVTSLAELGVAASMADVDDALQISFRQVFD